LGRWASVPSCSAGQVVVIARRQLGLLFYVGGGLLLSFAIGRYALGMMKRDAARRAWNEAEAREAVALVQSVANRSGRFGPIASGAPVARIVISAIDLDEIVLEGVDDEALNGGPGHLPGSAFPGERGNAVISAHRDRHFMRLGDVSVGDTIRTESGRHANTWVIVSKRVIGRNRPALFTTREPTLTLTTCWPIRFLGSAPDRLIVTAKPVAKPGASQRAVAGAAPVRAPERARGEN
jgi:LPXTG-site transpeptidase (sortase) family protein